jgi:transposase
MARYVGIDIAKARLDVAVREVEHSGEEEEPNSRLEVSFQVENTAEGRDQLVRKLREANPTRVVLEASGGLERPVVAGPGAADLPVVVVNPIQTSEFAKSLGRLEKTDQIEEVERELGELIESSPVWQAEADLLCSVPGIGETTARVLLARLPEFGEANREEIAKLVGLAHLWAWPRLRKRAARGRESAISTGGGPTAPCTWQRSRVSSITTESDPFMSDSSIAGRRQRLLRSQQRASSW